MKVLFKQDGGGIPPFNYYTPITYSGKKSEVTTGDSKDSNKDNISDKDILELIKGLKGLPSDINYFTNRIQQFFANPFTKDNPSSLVSMYASIVRDANRFQFSQNSFNDSKTEITNKGGLDEIAIDPHGRVAVQNQEGTMSWISPQEYYQDKGEKYTKVTNDDLLNLRAYNDPMNDQILTWVNSGTGMKDVTTRVNAMINTLGSSEYKESRLTNGQKAGFRLLTDLAMKYGLEGKDVKSLFDSEIITKEQSVQINAALDYVYTNLTDPEKALLISKTGSDSAAKQYLINLYLSKSSPYLSITNNPYEPKQPSDSDKVKSNPLLQMMREEGGTPRPLTVLTKKGDEAMTSTGTWYGGIPGVTRDCSLDELLTESGLQMMVDDKRNITFGNIQLDPDYFGDIMYVNNGAMVVSLPAVTTENGGKKVNLDVIDDYRAACDELKRQTGLQSPNRITTQEQAKIWLDIVKDKGLDVYYDENGKANPNLFGHFIVVQAYASNKIPGLKDEIENSDFVQIVDKSNKEFKALEEKIIRGLSTNSESEQDNKGKYTYDLDVKDRWIEPFHNDVYRANLFIPIIDNPNAAYNGFGDQIYQTNVDENERLVQERRNKDEKSSRQQTTSSNLLWQ